MTTTVPGDPGRVVTHHLDVAAPYAAGAILRWLSARAVAGVEVVDGTVYQRSLRLPGGCMPVVMALGSDHVRVDLHGARPADVDDAVATCRRVLDLDVDPAAVDGVLRCDPALAPLVARTAGLRLPGAADPAELAVRAILGQQVTLAAARTLASRLVMIAGEPTAHPREGSSHAFPTPGQILEADLTVLGMPGARQRAVRELCLRLVDGSIDLSGVIGRDEVYAQLREVPGIGPWTAGYVVLRGLHDPDVFLPGDVALRRAAAAQALPTTDLGLREHAERWRPWRSYAMQHLWQSLA